MAEKKGYTLEEAMAAGQKAGAAVMASTPIQGVKDVVGKAAPAAKKVGNYVGETVDAVKTMGSLIAEAVTKKK